MITALLSDFSRVLLNPKDKNYEGKLNALHQKLATDPNYHFFDYYEFNQELLAFYQQLKNKLSINIFTTGTMQNIPESRQVLDPIFTRIYSAIDMQYSKEDPQAYLWIANDLHKKPEELLFVDDDLKNIEAAKQAGLVTVHFISTDQAITDIKMYAKD